jgi:hypothetical protein
VSRVAADDHWRAGRRQLEQIVGEGQRQVNATV